MTSMKEKSSGKWEPFYVWWPMKIEEEWCWLSWQERRITPDYDYFGGYYGGGNPKPRIEYRIDTGDEREA